MSCVCVVEPGSLFGVGSTRLVGGTWRSAALIGICDEAQQESGCE
jgi:hypothetical protein